MGTGDAEDVGSYRDAQDARLDHSVDQRSVTWTLTAPADSTSRLVVLRVLSTCRPSNPAWRSDASVGEASTTPAAGTTT